MKQNKVFNLIKTDPDMHDRDVTIDYLIDNVWIVGSVETVTQKLEEMFHLVGGFGTLLIMGHEWLPEDKWKSCINLMIKEVAPSLQKKGV
jgi:alkanesulfonate monooxygenase SsuD/methylene tetrahydromethanopterin reductase-like flavin-dependent oxidoreductase (luciferase family)